MSDSPENGLAAVEPRARRTDGDLLPVTDLVTQILFDGNKTVRLTGEGKSTAIEHLRLRLEGIANIQFLDGAQEIEDVRAFDLTVFTAPAYCRGSVELKLARWTQDDWIEYLISKAPTRCKEVMGKLIASNDMWLANGSPRVIAKVLDTMIEDKSIPNTQAAIEKIVDSIPFKKDRHRSKIYMKCLEHAFRDKQFGFDTQKYVPRCIDTETLKLLGNQTVRYVPASRQLIKALGATYCLILLCNSFVI